MTPTLISLYNPVSRDPSFMKDSLPHLYFLFLISPFFFSLPSSHCLHRVFCLIVITMNHPTTSHFASQAYAAAVTAGYEPRHLHHPSYPHQQFGYGYGNPAPSGPTPPVSMPQFSAGNDQGPALAHPQQHHLHQLNMQQAAFQRSKLLSLRQERLPLTYAPPHSVMMQQQQQETEMLDSPMAAAVAGMASPSKK